MNKILKNIGILGCMFYLLVACSSNANDNIDNGGGSENGAPTDLTITALISGVTTESPEGDGSGLVNFTLSATNAVSYKITFGDNTEATSTTGAVSHTYNENGTNNYLVTVLAYGENGSFISEFVRINVLVDENVLSLVWSEDFDVDGKPNEDNWDYEIGRGNGGWGNNEAQYYTARSSNVSISNGILKITVKKENYYGAEYTSTRIRTKGKFEFKYGVIEVRAKLPSGGGTWPAIWMLGANFEAVGWPSCGEIDIMEHVGNDQDRIHGTLHYPGNYGGSANTNSTIIPNVSSEFKTYKTIWNENEIKFYTDDLLIHSFSNSSSVPFNHPFYMILNVAIGGSFGGQIDSDFTESSMEIDYIKVYQ
ncbi:family 16 glycosylhydrolase [Wenyingzhuangia sp. chi5]|uniref:Family 16 glycosylhydrolase n=1 Tax=Wenyingzhuangia gilva TaxID=3057677 RepID=A0ABT8VU86_9FLAO|nr:family 16 glycosylhydrolase [Wenyingzhuangia sp. chi5]MDO3695518.1 family 16 glycosylhydrolase [Wenyingzhuangia sp. chi5]